LSRDNTFGHWFGMADPRECDLACFAAIRRLRNRMVDFERLTTFGFAETSVSIYYAIIVEKQLGGMMNPPTSEKRIFRAAAFPIFVSCFLLSLVTSIVTFLFSPDSPFTSRHIRFMLVLSVTISTAATFFVWRVTAEVLSTDGVEIWTVLGRRSLPWKDVAAVRIFPSLKLVCLRFSLASGRSRRVLFFQRRSGEFSDMITDLVSKDSFVWRQLNDA
jgi:hypothetical protein